MSQIDEVVMRALIREQVEMISMANAQINELAKKAIPKFHFLDHQVSHFWDNCKESPIGYCVWDISERGFHIDCSCHFCGKPVERK